jgi:poly(3-hydroxybutyrate) depolymerase
MLAAATSATGSTAAGSLQAYNVDQNGTSVSGLSSGAFFAVQMHVAFSDFIVGAGVFAGGPYDCAEGSLTTAQLTCMQALTPPAATTYEGITDKRAQSGTVDPTANLASHNVFLFSGKDDTTVKPPVMDALNTYYQHYITAGKVTYVSNMAAAHTQPTDDPSLTNACTTSAPPYLSNCKYDGAGVALNAIYPGQLKPRNDGTLSGQLLAFSQAEFFGSGISTADTGYVYVPASCAAGDRCRLHVSFHGCLQNYASVGDAYTAHAGYNKWADTNNFVVLYPQTAKSQTSPSNPNACWDWWGECGVVSCGCLRYRV